LVGGLGDTVDSIRDIGRALDDLGVSRALGLGEGSTARRAFDDVARAMEDVAGKLGARIGPELLQSAAKALGKALPALGGVISGVDTARMAGIAADQSLPGEIRYIAGLGAGINGADTVLAVTEAFGIGNIGLPANLALGVGGFAADIAVTQMKQQHEDGNFNPSDELRALIGVSAVATAPLGLANLTNAFGINGSIDVLKDTIKVGGEYAGRAAEALFEFVKDKGEEAIRAAGEFVADLPEAVRNQIKGAVEGAADLFGNAAGAFADGLGDVASFFGDRLGGLADTLGGVVSNIPGPWRR
jgi:hypothetical protein